MAGMPRTGWPMRLCCWELEDPESAGCGPAELVARQDKLMVTVHRSLVDRRLFQLLALTYYFRRAVPPRPLRLHPMSRRLAFRASCGGSFAAQSCVR